MRSNSSLAVSWRGSKKHAACNILVCWRISSRTQTFGSFRHRDQCSESPRQVLARWTSVSAMSARGSLFVAAGGERRKADRSSPARRGTKFVNCSRPASGKEIVSTGPPGFNTETSSTKRPSYIGG